VERDFTEKPVRVLETLYESLLNGGRGKQLALL
jgi:hypothetical protein